MTRIEIPAVKDVMILAFVKFYGVDVDDVKEPVPGGFKSFNDFFTRELRSDSRPIDRSNSTVVSPADGFISAAGRIKKNSLLQAKGHTYSLEALLATDLDEARPYYDGLFATIYLAPFNYHRVHAPLAGELTAVRFVPGTLFSVNQATVSSLCGLFTRNERLICHFRTASGPMVLIFVGALNVGSITTRWSGELRPRKGNVVKDIMPQRSSEPRMVKKGELLGWFNMGSTVILLLPPGVCEWRSDLEPGVALMMGEMLGQITDVKT